MIIEHCLALQIKIREHYNIEMNFKEFSSIILHILFQYVLALNTFWIFHTRKRAGQRESLQRVYTWYMANKHVLYCGPVSYKSQG